MNIKEKWKLLKEKKEYLLLAVSSLLFSFSFILLLILFLFNVVNYDYLLGLILGYLFIVIGYFITIYTAKVMLKYRSIAIYIFFYIIKFIVYAIGIYIYTRADNYFNIYMLIVGFSLIFISEWFLPFFEVNKKDRKEKKYNVE